MTAMTDYLSGLIIYLCEAEIHVHGNKGLVSFPRTRNINDVCFWATNDTWNVGYSRWPMDPIAVLTTADRDVSLCWLICCTGNLYRKKQEWCYLLPLRTISGFVNGWKVPEPRDG